MDGVEFADTCKVTLAQHSHTLSRRNEENGSVLGNTPWNVLWERVACDPVSMHESRRFLMAVLGGLRESAFV